MITPILGTSLVLVGEMLRSLSQAIALSNEERGPPSGCGTSSNPFRGHGDNIEDKR
jgi:hypothetical protein